MSVKKQAFLKSHKAGFSLLELMVVVSIVSALISISLPIFQDMRLRARTTQGLTTGRVALTLVQSYSADEQDWSIPFGGMMLSNNNFVSVDSCNSDNIFGFKQVNCMKAYYFYSISKASLFAFEGWEGKGTGFGTSTKATTRVTGKENDASTSTYNVKCGDVWVMNERVSYHFIDVANPNPDKCKGWISKLVESFFTDPTNIDDDWNLDGRINISDFSSTFGMFPPFADSGLLPYYH